MADTAIERHLAIDCVVGIATGGIFIAEHVAGQLMSRTGITYPYHIARKDPTTKALTLSTDDAEQVANRLVYLVDDVVTTGGSLRKAIHLIENAGGSVVGIGALCNRMFDITSLGVPYTYVSYEETLGTLWEADACPMCS